MQTLLNDIELDIQELKCLVQAVSDNSNPALRIVAKRNICQMQARLEELSKLLESSISEEPSQKESIKEEFIEEESVKEEPVKVVEHPEPSPEVVSFVSPVSSPAPLILAESIKPAKDLRHAISLNDSFRFTRELFGGDATRMNEVVRQLGETTSLNQALDLFNSVVNSDEENVAAADFIELLKKYFS